MKKILIIFILLSVNLNAQSGSSSYVFVGPMLHFNIGNKENKFSFGLEASYWNQPYSSNTSVGADFGIEREFGTKKIRIYSEAQIGYIFGASLGPVLEIQNRKSTLGIQGSAWCTFFGGVDLRFRSTDSNYFAPGIMLKMLVLER
jgi:hypothetical protein